MSDSKQINYCALTTISISMRSFVLPSLVNLSKNGYQVTAGCMKDEQFANSLPKDISYLPLKIKRGYGLSCIMSTLMTIWQLYSFFQKNKTQMVEYGTPNISFCASFAAWFARVPVRIYNHWGARYIGFQGILRFLTLLIERIISFFSTDVRDVSPKNLKMCIKDRVYPINKAKVLGDGGTIGADFTRFDISKKIEYNCQTRQRYGIPENNIVFGDIGSIRKDKGTNELITAFRNLNHEYVWLMLVGDVFEADAPEKDLMDWARNCSHVVFTGRVMDVEHYVAAFDCLVHPSYREGLGMVLQEAGAMGVPYITSDIIGPSEFGINGKTGLLAKVGDADDLHEKMVSLINNREKLQEMSQDVYQYTKAKFERSIMLKRLLDDRNQLAKEAGLL